MACLEENQVMAWTGTALEVWKMDYDRIRYILSPEELDDKWVLVIGLGSGGAPIVQHLAMNGVKNWMLFDPDTLDEVNLVKHPGLRRDLGKTKVEIMANWIRDRNPSSNIREYPVDILEAEKFREEVRHADLVISATDKLAIREYIDEMCVREATPCVVGDVFRTGVGGQVYSYIPGKTGCYHCLGIVSEKNGWNAIDSSIEMTEDEKERIYGLSEREYKAAGLSMDIAIISAIFAKTALGILLENPNPRFFPTSEANYIIFYNRKLGPFDSLSSKKFFIPPQRACFCSSPIEEADPSAGEIDFAEEEV
jgi:molybdopterin/thiamine biosynthesis adenylyltransferase